MKFSLGHTHASQRPVGRRDHGPSFGSDLLLGIGGLMVLVVLAQGVALATNALVHLFGG